MTDDLPDVAMSVATYMHKIEQNVLHGSFLDPDPKPFDPMVHLSVNDAVFEKLSDRLLFESSVAPGNGATIYDIPVRRCSRLGPNIAAVGQHASGALTIWSRGDDGWQMARTPGLANLAIYRG